MAVDVSESREARWRVLVAEWSQSGESVVAFCERRGLKPPTFYAWRRRLASRPEFVPVRVIETNAAKRAGVSVALASGHRLLLERDFDPETLRAAVEALSC